MRKHALLMENVVVKIETLDESQYREKTKEYQLIVDIHDLLIEPQAGWVLAGNKLEPAPGTSVDLITMIKAKIRSFQKMAPDLLVDMYAQNTILGITTQQSDEMFSDYQDVLIRIREGAWPTALYALEQKQPSGFVTQEMINSWKNLLLSRMI
jgi:hypothetical protein